MNYTAKRIVLHSINGYDKKHDSLLQNLIDEKVLLFCAVGKNCQLWHDIMDEFYVAGGIERDFELLTTWHENETLQQVIEFAEDFDEFGGKVKVIEI